MVAVCLFCILSLFLLGVISSWGWTWSTHICISSTPIAFHTLVGYLGFYNDWGTQLAFLVGAATLDILWTFRVCLG